MRSEVKDLLEVGDRVGGVFATNEPKLSAPTPQKSSEILGLDQDATIDGECHHLLWRGGGIKDPLKIWITIYLVTEVIQGIQQWRRKVFHTEWSSTDQRYQGTVLPYPAAQLGSQTNNRDLQIF